MTRKGVVAILSGMMVFGLASTALAADGVAQAAGLWSFFGIAIACGFGIGLAAMGAGIGMGNAINGALQGTARNPEAGGKIMTTMIIGLALILGGLLANSLTRPLHELAAAARQIAWVREDGIFSDQPPSRFYRVVEQAGEVPLDMGRVRDVLEI